MFICLSNTYFIKSQQYKDKSCGNKQDLSVCVDSLTKSVENGTTKLDSIPFNLKLMILEGMLRKKINSNLP